MSQNKSICEPVQRKIAYSLLTESHPILRESKSVRQKYYNMLVFHCETLFNLSRYSKFVLEYYGEILNPNVPVRGNSNLNTRLKVILLLDIANILGYDKRKLNAKLVKQLQFKDSLSKILENLFAKFTGDNPMWEKLCKNKYVKQDAEWIEHVRQNLCCSETKPFRILITATMSAGKSTFINAIVGKKIASTKNRACTGRLHHIYSKPFDDGLVGKWDGRITLDAINIILDSKEELKSRVSYESVFFSGRLHERRCELLDTPGVNSAQFRNHGEVTKEIISAGNYHAIVFLINYEHIGTDDEKNHLSFILETVSPEIPIIFVVNKIDSKKSDDSSLTDKMQDVSAYLTDLGFKNPVVFLASSKAAYLYRKNDFPRNEDEEEQLELFMGKFRRRMNIINVYDSVKPSYIGEYDNSFEYQCGMGFVEDYINQLINNYERND